jgi:hypothetical protein
MDGRRWRLMVDQDAAQTAGYEIGSYLPGRDPYDSRAVLCRGYEGVKTVHPEPTRYSDFAFPFLVRFEAPLADTGRLRKHQAVVTAQIGRRLWDADALQVTRRSADDHLDIGELARDQLRIRQMTDAKRDMNVLFDHVDRTVEQQKLDGYRSMAARTPQAAARSAIDPSGLAH